MAASSVTGASRSSGAGPGAGTAGSGPANGGLILATLILVAAVANLPLAMANVALPTIGKDFGASQEQLNLVAVGYSLGLACSVLWLGALGDRYGRKRMAVLGVVVAMPAALIAGLAPSIEVLIAARLLGGFAAGMAYPTTLSLIAAIWPAGPARTRSIALWAALGAAISVSGPLLSGILLEHFDWGSVFLIVLPLAVVALLMAIRFIPAGLNESSDPVDNVGGALSVVLVGSFVLAINVLPVASEQALALGLLVVALVAGILFLLQQRRAANPLYDLRYARRPTFWVAALAGIIVFGSLMGAMFIGQQYLQNVLGYSTLDAGLAVIPAGFFMIIVAPRSAMIVESRGARFTLLAGYLFVLLGFVAMLVLWQEGSSYLVVAVAYSLVGIGVGLAGTPASRSLTGSVPVSRVGMASGTADLQRDLGGAIFNSLFGAILAAGYASAVAAAIAASGSSGSVPPDVTNELEMSYAGAQAVAAQYPQYATQITSTAKASFLKGDQNAYIAGIVAVLVGGALVALVFPGRDRERELLERYRREDEGVGTAEAAQVPVEAPAPA